MHTVFTARSHPPQLPPTPSINIQGQRIQYTVVVNRLNSGLLLQPRERNVDPVVSLITLLFQADLRPTSTYRRVLSDFFRQLRHPWFKMVTEFHRLNIRHTHEAQKDNVKVPCWRGRPGASGPLSTAHNWAPKMERSDQW